MFARDLGYGDLYVVNLFAWRATDWKILLENPESKVGPRCGHYIEKYVAVCDATVAAWGDIAGHDKLFWRAREIGRRFRNLWALKITKKGHPAHPLYLKKGLELLPFGPYC